MENLPAKQTSAIATSKEYLMTYNPKAMQVAMKSVTTIKQAKALETHSIARIRKDIGNTKIEALIKAYLINLNDLLNLKRPLTEDQIDEIASEVVSSFYQLSMADVNLIMKRAKSGYYGEFYESINMPKVMIWFSTYFEERCQVGINTTLDHHCNVKEYNDLDRTNPDENERNEFRKAKAHVDIIRMQAQKNKGSGKC